MIDADELEALYDEFGARLYGYLLTLTRRDADAADLLHDLFVKLARKPDCLDGVACRRAFLFRAAHNLAVDLARRARRRRARAARIDAAHSPDAVFASGADPDRETLRRELDVALAALPDEQRAAVYLRLWGGLTAAQVGDVCSVPTDTASSRYRYGLEKLRRELRPVYDEICSG